MAISTYAELQDAVAVWLNRPDVDQSVGTLISLTEADINRRLRHYKMTKRSVAEVDSQFSATPSDYLQTIRFSITSGSTNALDVISQNELLDRKSLSANTAGTPKFYAFTGEQFEFYPVPDDTYNAELVYYAEIEALSDQNTSNWLLSDAPDVYLYGTLAQSAPFLGDDARLSVWNSLYEKALSGLNNASDAARFGGVGLRLNIRSY
tara:strand:+ start:1985 stop:2605 length:621 start_codon:yes stop_codon:yes gene_type:complete